MAGKSTRTNAFARTLSICDCGGQRMSQEDLRQRFGLTPLPPIPYPVDNSITVGRAGSSTVFRSHLRRRNGCGLHVHLPHFGMADGRQTGAGTGSEELGPDRVGVSSVTGDTIIAEPRNTMTIFNTAYNKASNLPRPGFMLWDGKDWGKGERCVRLSCAWNCAVIPIRVRWPSTT